MTIGDLKIEGVKYLQLLNLEIFEAVHTHGICKLTLRVDNKFDDKKVLALTKTKITIKPKKGTDILFGGIVRSCQLSRRISENILSITAASLSCQLESARKFATFQSAKKKFSDMLSEVAKSYKPATLEPAKDSAVAEFIYRNNLTDWDFIKELAERHGQILFTDSRTDKLHITLGFKAFNQHTLKKNYQVLRYVVPMDLYKRLEQNTYSGARSSYFTETHIVTGETKIGVGHGVNFDNALQAVTASHIYLVENVLQNRITLRHAEGCRADAWDVTKYFDEFFYITGKVLESKDNNVKVQFDCDQKQSKDEAVNIPYESPVSNYLYTMPDEKDKVYVYVDKIRQAAMGSLRAKEVSDAAEKRSFKTKNSSLAFDPKKLTFAAQEKTNFEFEKGVTFNAPKNITITSSGDILLQSAGSMVPDNQLKMSAPHFAGYGQYMAGLGQPATVQFNPAGSTVGKMPDSIKNAGSKKEAVELSDLAKELDKKTNRKNKSEQAKSSGGGSGGSLKLDGKKSALVQVKDSSIEMKGSNLNVKTRALIQVGFIPMAGGGTGSLSKFEGGNPKNRSDKINAEKGSEDRSRVKEKVTATPDSKSISR